jgi:hypothetical protein
MKTFLISILVFGFAFLSNSQDDKKVPERKLMSKSSTTIPVNGKPERKMVDHSTAKTSKEGQTLGKPERKLVGK